MTTVTARMTARDVATKKLVTARPTSSITQVADLMERHRVKRVVIAKEENGLGIISQKDVVGFAWSDGTERTLDDVQAAEVMSKPLVTVHVDAPIPESATTMLEKEIGSTAVSDGKRLRGIITKTDLCRYYSLNLASRHKVRDFMTSKLLRVRPSHSIFYAARLMGEHKVSRLIVAEDGLRGIVTYSDLVLASPALRQRRLEGEEKLYRHMGFITISRNIVSLSVRDVMTRDPLTILEDQDLAEAARQMLVYGISGLPVLDDRMRLAGIVTKTDVVRAIAGLPG